MSTFYATEYVGSPRDGTVPPRLLDGRLVDAKRRRTRATKDQVNPLAAGDKVYIGRLPVGAAQLGFSVNTDTSLGSATVSVGTLANPTKYVNAATVTATNQSVSLPVPASVAALAPLAAEDEVYVTVGAAAIPAAVLAVFAFEYTISA